MCSLSLSVLGCYGEVPPVSEPAQEHVEVVEHADVEDPDPSEVVQDAEVDAAPVEISLNPAIEGDPSPALRRLTATQYRHTLSDWFGPELVVPSMLEPDARSEGLYAVGASVNGVSSLGVERYVNGAKSVASQLVTYAPLRAALIDCSSLSDDACLTTLIDTWGLRLWRRPPSDAERARVLQVAEVAMESLGGLEEGIRYAMTTLLASPHFLYAHGISAEGAEASGHYSDWQVATRLALFLWDSGPDAALLAEAAAGTLSDPEHLRAVVQGMLADARARRGLKAFVDDWLELDLLSQLNKDPSVFPYFSPDIGQQAREETLRLIEHLVFDSAADFRTLMTTRTTFVTRRLAGLYGVVAPEVEDYAQISLPEEGPRAGLLGHASVLAAHASPNRSSPTLRGVFVRERLLCQHMPSPPANVDTTIPDGSADAPTMRERLQVHLESPACSGCHALTDLIGLGLERFDGLGGFRESENGVPIDPSGDLDAHDFDDAVGLGQAIAEHPDFVPCIVDTLWSFANGRVATAAEVPQLDALVARFEASDHRMLTLLEDIVMSEAFRRVGALAEGGP